VVLTVLDPYTFDSEWVCLENQWAREAAIPVVPLYDGDRFRWEQLAKWRADPALEHVFKRQTVNYQKDYRVESKKRLLAAIREASAAAPDVVAPSHSLSSASANATLSPTSKRATPSSLVRIAVGKSTDADPRSAVTRAWSHLVSKLGGVHPNMVIAAYTGKHDGVAIASALADTASAGCQVVGVSAGCGIIFDDQWLSGASGAALSLWGIVDPAGAYEVSYCGTGLQDDVQSAVKRALEPHVARGRPRLTLAYTTPTFEASSIGGIQQIVGEDAVLFGIGVLGPAGFDTTSTANKPTVFALVGGASFDASTQLGCGVVSAFCWPSVFIAGAFTPGGQCCSQAQRGTITKVASGPSQSLLILPEGQLANASPQRPEPTDTVIVEIDGRPAVDVYKEWLAEADCAAIEALIAKGELEPSDISAMTAVVMNNPLGVLVGTDENERPVHKTIAAMGASKDGLSLYGGLSVIEGATIEMMTPGDAAAARVKTADTASRVLTDAGFDFDSVQGCLTVGCGLYYMLGGYDDGLKDLAEKLGGAVNWAPSMGILGGPELGPMGDRADYAVYTVGCIVFSSKPAKAPTLMLTNEESGPGMQRRRSSTTMFVG